MQETVTLKGRHGYFQTTPSSLDIVIDRYLPGSVDSLRGIIQERTGETDYKISSVSEALLILAELDGYATN